MLDYPSHHPRGPGVGQAGCSGLRVNSPFSPSPHHGATYLMVRWRLLGCGGKDEGGPLLRSSTDCSRGLFLSELGAPLSVLSMSYLGGQSGVGGQHCRAQERPGLVSDFPFRVPQGRIWCQIRRPTHLSPPALPGPASRSPEEAPQEREPFPQRKSLLSVPAASSSATRPSSPQPDSARPDWLPEDRGCSLTLALPATAPTAPPAGPQMTGPLLNRPTPWDGDAPALEMAIWVQVQGTTNT